MAETTNHFLKTRYIKTSLIRPAEPYVIAGMAHIMSMALLWSRIANNS